MLRAMLHLFEGEPPQFSQIQDHSEGLKSYPAYSNLLDNFLDKYFDPTRQNSDANNNLCLFIVKYFDEML